MSTNAPLLDGMKEKLANAAWVAGVRSYRLARKVHIADALEPAFLRLAKIVPRRSGEVVAALANGSKLIMPPGYRDARTVVAGLFQADESKLFEQLIEPGMVVLDVGAYVGYFTLLAARLVGPAGRVFAFEPDDLAFSYLKRNVELNGCDNAQVVNAASSDAIGRAFLHRDPSGPESYIADVPSKWNSATVETTTLDSIMASAGWPAVHVIKLNIEGHELRALRGMRELSRRNRGLKLIMEFNPAAMARSGTSRAALETTLSDLGFSRGQIVERGMKAITPPRLLPPGKTVYNLLLTR